MDTQKIVLKVNNCATNDPCAICGHRTDPVTGAEMFLENTYALVCDQCGETYAPELKQARDLLQKPVRLFKQFDVFQRLDGGDDIITPDQDGDCLFGGGPNKELKNTNELRVMVPENRTAEEVIRGLKKVIAWIEEDPSTVDVPPIPILEEWDAQWQPVIVDD